MGSQYSSICDRMGIDKLCEASLLFSDFCGSLKQNNDQNDKFLRKLISKRKFPFDCDPETMESVVHLWCINCLSAEKWHKLNSCLKNQLIHDFLNTLYCTSHAFDEVFLLLFTNPKSRSFMFGYYEERQLPANGLRDIVEDILRFSSSVGLKYYTHSKGLKSLESIVDFPLKTFSLCPCTRRPLYVAMYLSRPDVVHLLLKHGARIPYEDTCNCMDSRHPLINVMDILKVNYEQEKEDDLSETSMTRKRRNVLSLKLILVDMNHYCDLWVNVCDVLKLLNGHAEYDRFPSLKHICRARIRQILRSNLFLSHPHIWNILCLPDTLMSYMNIDEF